MKIYGLLNGFFYVLYGFYGAIFPKHLASEVMGWTPNLLGLHQIRAMWMFLAGLGIVCLYGVFKGHLRNLTKALVLITLCLAAGRILGLLADGTGPTQTYFEIGFELFWSAVGFFLLTRHQKTLNT